MAHGGDDWKSKDSTLQKSFTPFLGEQELESFGPEEAVRLGCAAQRLPGPKDG